MTEVSDGILSKIRLALALAEREDTPRDEAENAMAHAQRMMAKYGVERSALLVSDPQANPVGDRIIKIPAPYAMGKLILLRAICDATGVRHVRLRNRGADEELHLFGLASDLEMAEMMFTSLLLQGARFIREDQADNVAYRWKPKSWTRDWQEGFANRVGRRLAAMYRQARVEQPEVGGVSTALVLVRKDELVSKAVSDKYPKLVFQRSTRQVGAGWGHGDAAGQRADLGGAKLRGGDSRALGR